MPGSAADAHPVERSAAGDFHWRRHICAVSTSTSEQEKTGEDESWHGQDGHTAKAVAWRVQANTSGPKIEANPAESAWNPKNSADEFSGMTKP